MKRLLIALSLLALCVTANADLIKQGSTYNRTVLMVDSTDGYTGKTGLTLTVIISKNGGAEATITPTITERGHGKYTLALSATDTNTLGGLDLLCTASGAIPSDTHDQVVSLDPNGTSDAIIQSLAVDYGTAQAGTATTIQLKAGAPAYDLSGQYIFLLSGTGSGPAVATLITAYNTSTKTATVASWPTGTPDATTIYIIRPQSALLAQEHTEVAADTKDGLAGGALGSPTAGSVYDILGKFLFDGSSNVKSQVNGYASLQDPATIVLGATASSYNSAGTIGNKINASAAAGDPWSVALPGSYASGTAGNILGNNLNAAITSRMATFSLPTNFSLFSIDGSGRVDVGKWLGSIPNILSSGRVDSSVGAYPGNTVQTGDAYARLGAAGAGLTALGDTRIANLDAAVSSRSTYAGGDTSGITTLLTRIPGTVQPQTGDSFARLGAPSGASVSADVAAVPTNVLGATLQGGLTVKQAQNLALDLSFDADRTWNATTHTSVYTWYARNSGVLTPDKSRPVLVKTTVYASDNVQITTQTTSVTASNLN